jgi:pimeloyl-ACP methyl ester carboxylesterase
MDDIRAVMDAAGSERAAIMCFSEGGPMSVLFAATYPERTAALVLYSTPVSWFRTRPAVRQHDGQRPGRLRLESQVEDVSPVQRGDPAGQRVDPGLLRPPVISVGPVPDEPTQFAFIGPGLPACARVLSRP